MILSVGFPVSPQKVNAKGEKELEMERIHDWNPGALKHKLLWN